MSPYRRYRAQYAAIWRDLSKERRDRNRLSGSCVNETKAGTHGIATHGNRCRRCKAVALFGAEVVAREGVDALVPPNADVIADQHDARSAA